MSPNEAFPSTNNTMNSASWIVQPTGFPTAETLLDEVPNHTMAQNVRRHSRGSISQKTAPMRVVKPSSASNSPRNSMGLGRRMTDGAYRRRLAMLEQGTKDTSFIQQPPAQTSRPMSWHPATQVTPAGFQQYPQHYAPVDNTTPFYDYQPSPATYSGFNSPSSVFSPIPAYVSAFAPSHYSTHNRHSYHLSGYTSQETTTLPPQPIYQDTSANLDPTMYSHFDWSNFAANGFEDSSTTPPTPENFLPIQHPEPSFQAEDTIQYQPLDESDDGEELIGMGLYDTPEAKSPPSDPHLDNYRALMMSQLLGTPYRRPEPTGKGLKLEETWAPPASEDEDDSDQDGDAEEEEEPVTHAVNDFRCDDVNAHLGENFNMIQQSVHTYSQAGWL